MRHSKEKIKQCRALREKGYSIIDIMQELSLPKTTVWNNVHDIKLSTEQKKALESSRGGSRKRKLKSIELAKDRAKELFDGPYRHFITIITMLYWAEGHKKGVCVFTNTDQKMIKVYLSVLRNILKIPEHRLKITIRIFTGMIREECLKFWSEVTNISPYLIKVRFNDGGTSGRTKYGMCQVTIRKGHNELKLMDAFKNVVAEQVLSALVV